MRDEIGVYEFVISLAVALEIDEQEFFRQYILAHGDPKKFRWIYRGSVSGGRGSIDLQSLAKEGLVASPVDADSLAHLQGVKKVSKRTLTYPDGREVVEYIDSDGNRVDMDGHVFMKSKKAERASASASGSIQE